MRSHETLVRRTRAIFENSDPGSFFVTINISFLCSRAYDAVYLLAVSELLILYHIFTVVNVCVHSCFVHVPVTYIFVHPSPPSSLFLLIVVFIYSCMDSFNFVILFRFNTAIPGYPKCLLGGSVRRTMQKSDPMGSNFPMVRRTNQKKKNFG